MAPAFGKKLPALLAEFDRMDRMEKHIRHCYTA